MVKELYISTLEGEFKKAESLHFDEGGIIGSKHHNKNLQRSVLLSSTSSYELASSHNISINYGDLGENILLDYKALYELKPYDRVQIGEVVFEITQNCTLCKSLSGISSKLPKLLKDDRGIFVKVIQGGVVHKHDTLNLI